MEETMRPLLLLVIPTLIFSGCAKQIASTSQTISSSTDADGKMHPAQVQSARGATVTCLSAIGDKGSAAKCNVNGAAIKPPSESVAATDKVYMFCEGTAPSKCTAEVVE
jgi:hypothetical protein